MKSFHLILFCVCLIIWSSGPLCAQADSIPASQKTLIAQEDPTQLFTRVEVFSEFEHFDTYNLNVTTLRAITKIGKSFTTRLDIPIVYNSLTKPGESQFGWGDISVRLLGYRFFQTKRSAFATSVEFSFNTASSEILGTGKNMIVPTIGYSQLFPKQRMIFTIIFGQYNSLWGDEYRQDISFSKIESQLIKLWNRRIWTVLIPKLFLDYVNGGASMNLEAKAGYRISKHLSFWLKGGAGLFGDHPARYVWTSEIGFRWLIMKSDIH